MNLKMNLKMILKRKKYFSKKGSDNVKFILKAKGALPGAKIATLGQKRINMKLFCDDFNKQSVEFIKALVAYHKESSPLITEELLMATELFVKMRIYADKTYELKIKSPSNSYLIKALSNITSGSKLPGKESAGSISSSLVMQIAKFKMDEMNARSVESAYKMICGTARSMGIEVKND